MILILGQEKDDHVRHMKTYLKSKKEDVRVMDLTLYPHNVKLSYCPNVDEWNIKNVKSIYWRGIAVPYDGLVQSFLTSFKTNWVNGLDGYLLHQAKPLTLSIVKSLGYLIPNTMCTNYSDHVKALGDNHKVIKPINGGQFTEHYIKPLGSTPAIVQDLIEGTNIRAFVIGDKVLACEIRTPHLDFRTDPRPEVLVHDIGYTGEQRCLAIAKALHLKWASIDYRLTPEGDYIFLEANPSSMFIEFERRTKLPITEYLGKLLYD